MWLKPTNPHGTPDAAGWETLLETERLGVGEPGQPIALSLA